jgi:serine/threonine-protein kinase RsbW
MATVEVSFTPLPAHVRTARLVATAVARRSGVDEALLDEVRLAVGEACSRAVEAHRRHCPTEPVRIEMTDLGERFEVIVRDSVPPAPARPAAANGHGHISHAQDIHALDGHGHDGRNHAGDTHDGSAADDSAAYDTGADGSAADGSALPPGGLPGGFGLAVISGLADDVRISATGSGVSVRMTWPAAVAAQALRPEICPRSPASPVREPLAGAPPVSAVLVRAPLARTASAENTLSKK